MRPNIARSVIPWIAAAILAAACSKPAPDILQKGKDFLAKGDLNSAVIEFRNAVQADATSLDARLALGEALERTGDLDGAEQNYRRALELGGNADDLVPRIAILMLDRGDIQTIVREFGARQLPLPTADSNLRGIVALAQLSLGKQDAAGAALAAADANAPAVRLARAQMAATQNRPDDAAAELDAVLKQGNAPWWVLRAASRVFQARGEPAKALDAMKGAYDLAGAYPSVVGEYAEQLFQAGRPADAKPLLDKLHRIAPRYYRTAYLDALFLARDGKLDEAHDAVSKVLAKLPDHAPSLLLAAQTELERGQLASATTHVEQLLAKHPSSLAALRLKLALDVRNGDIQSAAATLARALQVSPNDRGLLAASADLAWARGDRATALKQLAATAQTQPLDAKLLVRLAEMRSAVGQKAQAAESITQAIELARDDANLRGQILRSLTGMGMLDKAKALAGAEVERRPKEPEPLLWLASVLGMTGDEKAALEQTGRSLDLQPDYYPALLALGRTANSPERAKEYQARLQKAVDAGTKNPTIYLDFARKLTIDGADAATVGSLLEKGLSADPASVPVRRALVSHWLASNMKDKAVKVAAEGDASQPDNVALRSLAAATYEAVGDFDKAASKYAELEARFPDRAEWGMSRARVLLSAGKPQDAMLALRKVTADHPEDPAAYRMLAFVQADQKLLPDALVTADMLAAKSKLRAAGLLLRGDLYARTQDKSEAIKAYDEAAKAGATEEAMIRRVELQDRTGGEAFAAGELSEWMKAHPGSVPALSLAARRAAGKQDHATAIRHLEAIVKLQPGNAVALNELAWTYVLAKNPAALPTAGKAAMLLPDNPQVLDTLAEALALAGRKAEAVAKLKEASALAPGNPVFRVHLAELVAEQGNKKDAAALIEGLEKATLDKETAGRLKALKGRL